MAFAQPISGARVAEAGLARPLAALAMLGGGVRLLLWVPVAMGAGSVAYFALGAEPARWIGGTVALAALAGALLCRALPLPRLLLAILCAAGVGFGAAQLRTATLPPLAEVPTRAVIVTATVKEVEALPEGRRVRLGGATIGDAAFGRDIRVRLRDGDASVLGPGDRIQLRALLRAPAPPAVPGGFDFQRFAYFDGLGAVGTALGPVTVLAQGAESGASLWLAGVRQVVLARVGAAVAGADGAVAAALLTGARAAIPTADLAAMRDSGLAHLLSVSGLHVAIVAGVVFGTVRLLLAVTGLALIVHAKKVAAVAGIIAAFGYMLLTGSEVPMQRAVAMAALFALAVLLDRHGIGMRALALAAIVVLAFQPEAVLGPSFQMSFGAVLALIAAYEFGKPWLDRVRAAKGLPARLAAGLLLLCFTSLVASAATAPFAAWHFQRVQIYGIAANALAVPLTSIVVMPAGLLGLLLMPLGLEGLALVPMGWAVGAILWAARTVASWPGAAPLTPAMPAWGILAVAGGLLTLSLCRGRAAVLGIVPLVLGLASPWVVAQPDLIMNPTARIIAMRTDTGYAAQAVSGASRIEREMIAARLAVPALDTLAEGTRGNLTCTAQSCTLRGPAGQAILLLRPGPHEARCDDATLVVAAEPLRGRCRPSPMIDRFSVWREGAHAAWFTADGGVRVVSDRALRGDRPWVAPAPLPSAGRPSRLPEARTLDLPAEE
ncbi:ComEC/Rec2 family competence protein [Elioraea sp.]|uniref:ComEC/Rec2 family competence protein n=1 Tax=Elioraea sp. TaxID=2185103 RepID=UPI0025BFB9B7|nr:ComEC/Rec2 family competence protein [Elioraea sp.]